MATKTVSNKTAVPAVFFPSAETIPARLQVDGPAFAKWRKIYAKAKAMEKEEKSLRAEVGLPDSETIAKMLGVKPDAAQSAVIVDGNGSPIGKLSAWWSPAFEMPASYKTRVS
jgi:hypothetical protein